MSIIGTVPFEDLTSPVDHAPRWIRSGTVSSVPNGEFFRAVRVPHADALRALQADLGLWRARVICGNASSHMLFLFPPGTSRDGWDIPGIRFLRDGARVEVPPLGAIHGPDIHWLTPPHRHQDVDPARLRAAFTGTPRVSARPAAARRTRRAKPGARRST
ncbi:hypothetical protein SMD44_p10123 (plasmid) [Streptomyces alboflavus]|uniref:Uncharacterized protein n=1 Tax=Streptomyces alboflavus TaxID=67267 RepID=A0A291W500_9ACTN|nr:hypothetical protein [Streptomyces alboflavus]ATM24622.1 hypothetical protein SMD44_p10123 [Streptomyces alboflavus]